MEAAADLAHPLYRKVDLSRIAVVGHSFGGAAAVIPYSQNLNPKTLTPKL